MLNKILFISAICVLMGGLFSCKNAPEKDFNTFRAAFIQAYSVLFPDESPLSKNNPYLVEMHIPHAAIMDSVTQFHHRFDTDIQDFDVAKLSDTDRRDYDKIKSILRNVQAYLSHYQDNPAVFNVFYPFSRLLNSSFDTPENRLQIIFNKLDKVPIFYEAAKSQTHQATVQQADETIERHLETYRFFDETLPQYLEAEHFITPQYQERLEIAKRAIKDYIAYVESLRLR